MPEQKAGNKINCKFGATFSSQHYLRFLHQLEVAEGGELQGAGLEGVAGLVDDQDVQDDVVLVDVNIGLGIDRVRETSQLGHLNEGR